MKNIFLIRPGQSLAQTDDQNHKDNKNSNLQGQQGSCFLSNKGIREAKQLRSVLSDSMFMKEQFSMSQTFDLVCTSPSIQAIATTVLGLGHILTEHQDFEEEEEKQVYGVGEDSDGEEVIIVRKPIPFICHPNLAEIYPTVEGLEGDNSKLAEKRHCRPINQALQEIQQKLQHFENVSFEYGQVMKCIDFSLLPSSWSGNNEEERSKRFLEWLHSRPESNIAVICDQSMIQTLLLLKVDDNVPNAYPIACVLHNSKKINMTQSPFEADLDDHHITDAERRRVKQKKKKKKTMIKPRKQAVGFKYKGHRY